MIRAKFACSVVQPINGNKEQGVYITLSAVYTGSEENKEFFKYTPGGQIVLHVVNPKAAEQFEQGKEYYVDFTKTE